MRRAALGSFVFFLVAPCTVAGLVPWLITGWDDPVGGWRAVVGWIMIALGVGFMVHAFLRFVAALGTPAPIAPTERLVVSGVYRFVRNPMYLALFTAITGQALAFGSLVLFVYGVVVLAVTATFVRLYEEPTLRQQFGREYADYCANVPGWVPRLSPWRQPHLE
jgi:protein-S-isoprenylcysteine O-methyltransferase Ste14